MLLYIGTNSQVQEDHDDDSDEEEKGAHYDDERWAWM